MASVYSDVVHTMPRYAAEAGERDPYDLDIIGVEMRTGTVTPSQVMYRIGGL
jgi:hypothetical protein